MTCPTLYDVYTDGGFRDEQCRWAFAVVDGNDIVYENWGIVPEKYNKHRQVGGELVAIGQAVLWAANNNYRLNIYYDYNGVYNWVKDLFGGGRAWQRKNEITQRYRKFMESNFQYVNKWAWVKGHSGDKWNEYVDQLMWNGH